MTVRSVFSPGEDAFSSDLILRVNDRAPYRFYTGYENSGNELTGENRFMLGANFGNLFNQGHLLNYQFTMGDDLDEFSAHSFSYRIPFNSKAQVDVYGGFVSTEAETGPFTIEGESIELGARYTHYFQLQPRLSQGLFGGLAWKSSDNGLEFGLEPTSQNKSQVAQLEAGYLLTHRRADSILDLNTSLIFSPGGIVSDADDSDYEAFREGAESQYGYLKLHLNWLKRLPLNLSYQSDIRGQLASGPLLASEQISLGGYNSVRGYEEREFNQTDSGIIWRNEFSLPPLRFDLATGIQSALQFLVFSDYGFGTAESGVIIRPDGSTTESDEMWSIGAGLRLSVNRNFTLRADYGHQLLESTTGEDGMLHLSAILSY
jgi:hemolysin activation/secretion protein